MAFGSQPTEGGVVLEQGDWIEETERLHLVLAEVRAQQDRARAEFSDVREDMVRDRREFWDEFRFKPGELYETLGAVLQQNKMLAEGERRFRQAAQTLRDLGRLERSPYFGRVDFAERGAGEPEKIYIGVASLRTADDDFLVYDWRAPIASLYYDQGPGTASYMSPMGEVSGQMHLKRQFVISEGQLRMMFDTGVTIGDELLMEALSGHSDAAMHAIVATIQREQNLVIRDDRHRLLIVLGSAGSGKTSVALQRVAYLLYRHRDTLRADQMVLFSPNALFNSYVATVLPELGEEPLQQTTFQQLPGHRLGRTYRLEDAYDQLEDLMATPDQEARSVRLEGIRYKSSPAFRHVLDRYAEGLRREGLVFVPVRFRGKEIVSARAMQSRFEAFGPDVPVSTRVSVIHDWIVEKVAAFEKRESQEDWVDEEVQLLGPEEFQRADLKVGRRRTGAPVDQVEAVRGHLGAKIVHRNLQSAKQWVEQRQYVDLEGLYLRLFKDRDLLSAVAAKEPLPRRWDAIRRDTLARLERTILPYEDATPLLYLDTLVRGARVNRSARHVIVDEAQDYSPLQFEVLRRLFPSARLTLLGDPHQTVSAAPSALTSPEDLQEHVGPGEMEVVRLRQSYRSTREIVEFTRSLLPTGADIVPFERRGEKPQIVRVANRQDLGERIALDIASLRREGLETVAVICKTARESREAFSALQSRVDLQLIEKDASSFSRGVLVLPGYLAKGLEFDAVIIFDASAQVYGGPEELGLLYTACTRAMHRLHLYTAGDLSPLLAAADPGTYVEGAR